MRLTVDHLTTYRYDVAVRGVVQSHRLLPTTFDGQKVLSWSVEVSGGTMGGQFRDGAGDEIRAWTVAGPVSDITVHVRGEVETFDTAGLLRGHRESAPPLVWLHSTQATEADVALTELARGIEAETDLDLAHGLAAAVGAAIAYAPGTTTAQTTAAAALAQGHGVCQDHAHVLIACARVRGLPARYVSGYLQADAAGMDHDAAHAWAELWVQGLGWIGFDATNRCCPDERYIRLGSGLDAQDAAPIRGIARGGAGEEMSVSVAVRAAQSQHSQ